MAPDERTASFGYWVRRQRQALDLTQAALARQVGCATVTISKIEQKLSFPWMGWHIPSPRQRFKPSWTGM